MESLKLQANGGSAEWFSEVLLHLASNIPTLGKGTGVGGGCTYFSKIT